MASSKREFAREDDAQPEQPESKRIRSDADGSDSPKLQPCRNSVVLNPADCNLGFLFSYSFSYGSNSFLRSNICSQVMI